MASKFPISMTDVNRQKDLIETKDVLDIVPRILKNLASASRLGHSEIILALNADVNRDDLVATLMWACPEYKILRIYPRRPSQWETVENDIVEYVFGSA
jgi:hypothetical protein